MPMENDYSLKKWEKETSIHTICKCLLDNAEMDIEIDEYPFSIQLTFFIVGTILKVIFDCNDIELFSLKKDWDNYGYSTVLEVYVTEPQKPLPCEVISSRSHDSKDYLWKICLPGQAIEIECLRFKWRVEEMTAEEINTLNE
jgi:hypothetical protein